MNSRALDMCFESFLFVMVAISDFAPNLLLSTGSYYGRVLRTSIMCFSKKKWCIIAFLSWPSWDYSFLSLSLLNQNKRMSCFGLKQGNSSLVENPLLWSIHFPSRRTIMQPWGFKKNWISFSIHRPISSNINRLVSVEFLILRNNRGIELNRQNFIKSPIIE